MKNIDIDKCRECHGTGFIDGDEKCPVCVLNNRCPQCQSDLFNGRKNAYCDQCGWPESPPLQPSTRLQPGDWAYSLKPTSDIMPIQIVPVVSVDDDGYCQIAMYNYRFVVEQSCLRSLSEAEELPTSVITPADLGHLLRWPIFGKTELTSYIAWKCEDFLVDAHTSTGVVNQLAQQITNELEGESFTHREIVTGIMLWTWLNDVMVEVTPRGGNWLDQEEEEEEEEEVMAGEILRHLGIFAPEATTNTDAVLSLINQAFMQRFVTVKAAYYILPIEAECAICHRLCARDMMGIYDTIYDLKHPVAHMHNEPLTRYVCLDCYGKLD